MLTPDRIAAYYQTPHTPSEPQAPLTLSPAQLAALFGEGARIPTADYLLTLLLLQEQADADRQQALSDAQTRAATLLSRLFPQQSEEAEVTDPLGLLLTLLEARGAVLP